MNSETNRLLQSLLLPKSQTAFDRPWQPALDVYRLQNGWLLKFELAGVDPEDITITVHGRRVSVRGARLDRHHLTSCSLQQMEIAYTTFERCVELPEDPGDSPPRMEIKNGMLYVFLQGEASP